MIIHACVTHKPDQGELMMSWHASERAAVL